MREAFKSLVWLIVVAVFIGVGLLVYRGGRRQEQANPFAYDLESLKRIDPALVTHTEVGGFPIDAPAVSAFPPGLLGACRAEIC